MNTLGLFARTGAAAILERLDMTDVRKARVVAYHGTSPRAKDAFRRMLDYLAERYVGLDEEGLASFLAGDWQHDRPGLAITFDDGLRSNFEVAAPLLEERGFRGWFFATGGLPGLPAEEQAAFCARNALVAATEEGRIAMDWAELRDLVRRGHAVGCHTHSHARLHSGIGEDEARRELADCVRAIEDATGSRPRSFAWVGGESWTYGPGGMMALRGAGFDFAFSTKSGPVKPGDEPLCLHRTVLDADMDFDVFRLKLHGLSDLVHRRARRRLEREFGAGGGKSR